jgi:hypothetical protein
MGRELNRLRNKANFGRARLNRLQKNSGCPGFVSGHDFSRAVNRSRFSRALPPVLASCSGCRHVLRIGSLEVIDGAVIEVPDAGRYLVD